jgi:hypothetical protein
VSFAIDCLGDEQVNFKEYSICYVAFCDLIFVRLQNLAVVKEWMPF